jgi:hypothetical protein
MMPPELDAHIELLRSQGHEIDTVEADQRIYLIFRRYSLGPTYRPPNSDLMVFTTVQYPNAGFDMFWVSDDVVLAASGGPPQSGDQFETYVGRRWRRFSWHLNRPWNPSRDTLLTWMSTVDERLHRGV